MAKGKLSLMDKTVDAGAEAGLVCAECGATKARNGSAFTARTLRAHLAQVHRKLVKPVGGRELSHRQRELMELVVVGFKEAEIAERMGLSIYTVHTHVRNIYRKLVVRNRAEAVMTWLRRNGRLAGPRVVPTSAVQFKCCPACGCHFGSG
jgi:DNA-binding NarL/FixJ family response regulator